MAESQNSSASQQSDAEITKLFATAEEQLAKNLNSTDWKYLDEEKTLTYIEQSCKLAVKAFVFSPNTEETWESVKQMLSDYLTNIWKEGALEGATAADAFSVEVGRGSRMPSVEIINDLMDVSLKVAVVEPAEFVVITFQQQMVGTSSQMMGDD
jgi:phage tail sheath protein FI